jgi:YHS domain-containing protein
MNPHVKKPNRARSRFALALGVLGLLYPHPVRCADEPATIVWRDDYGRAMEDARAANRLLWIQFTGPWCPNCTRMENDSFPHPAIVEHAQRSYVPLKLRSDLNEQLVAAFNLTAIPATVVVAPNRDIIAFHQGYLGPQELDGLLRDCQARFSPRPEPAPPAAGSQEQADATSDLDKKAEPRAGGTGAAGGYCVVSLVDERKLLKGRSEHVIEHEGRAFYFATAAAGERFRQNRDRYVPWNGGACPVTQLERGKTTPGDPRWGILYAGQLFLCASAEDRRRFFANPSPFATQSLPGTESSSADSRSQAEANRSSQEARASNFGG